MTPCLCGDRRRLLKSGSRDRYRWAIDHEKSARRLPGTLRARIAVLPTQLESACEPLLDAGLGLIAHPGVAFAYAISDEAHTPRVLAAVDSSVVRVAGEVRWEELPTSAKAERDVFGDPGPRLALMRALKRQFDPAGILNPRRSQGRV